MTSLSSRRRAFPGDVRFLIGIVLVVLSIGGVWVLVAASDDVTPVLQANRTITEGEVLVAGDFQVADVGLGALAGQYLTADGLGEGQVAARTLHKGELVPLSAAADAADARTTTIVIESSTRIPQDVIAGSVVEIWHAPPLDEGRTFDSPRILVADVIVREVIESEGMLADSGASVELVIDRADVSDVLAAVTGGSALSLVPANSGS